MAKTPRQNFKMFASTPGLNEVGVFGSFAAGSPTTSTDVETIQSLSAWLEGWYGAVLADKSPCIEDFNAFCFVLAYMIYYNFEMGIPERDSETTYYIGSLVNDGNGNLYKSIIDDNLDEPLGDQTKWLPAVGKISSRIVNASEVATVNDQIILCDTSPTGGFTITLPPILNWPNQKITIKCMGLGTAEVITVDCSGEVIDGQSNIPLQDDTREYATFYNNGSSIWIVG